MKTLYRIYEFLFDRWKSEIIEQGLHKFTGGYHRDYVKYKLVNKFDGSIKIVMKYLN